MEFFRGLSDKYNEVWKNIIQPQRQQYFLSDLGPKVKLVQNIPVIRKDLQIKNKQGNTLQCTFFSAENFDRNATACVIYLHGNAGSRIEALTVFNYLLPKTALFCFDFIGAGKSDGEFVTLGVQEANDLVLIVDYVRNTLGISKIGLWGRSMGAATAINYCANYNNDKAVSVVACDSAFMKLETLIEEIGKERTKIPGLLLDPILSLIKSKISSKLNGLDIFSLDVLQCVQKITSVKGMIFACTPTDSVIQSHHTMGLYNAYKGEKEIVQFDGDHNTLRPPMFFKAIVRFFEQRLYPATSGSSNSQQNLAATTNTSISQNKGFFMNMPLQMFATDPGESNTGSSSSFSITQMNTHAGLLASSSNSNYPDQPLRQSFKSKTLVPNNSGQQSYHHVLHQQSCQIQQFQGNNSPEIHEKQAIYGRSSSPQQNSLFEIDTPSNNNNNYINTEKSRGIASQPSQREFNNSFLSSRRIKQLCTQSILPTSESNNRSNTFQPELFVSSSTEKLPSYQMNRNTQDEGQQQEDHLFTGIRVLQSQRSQSADQHLDQVPKVLFGNNNNTLQPSGMVVRGQLGMPRRKEQVQQPPSSSSISPFKKPRAVLEQITEEFLPQKKLPSKRVLPDIVDRQLAAGLKPIPNATTITAAGPSQVRSFPSKLLKQNFLNKNEQNMQCAPITPSIAPSIMPSQRIGTQQQQQFEQQSFTKYIPLNNENNPNKYTNSNPFQLTLQAEQLRYGGNNTCDSMDIHGASTKGKGFNAQLSLSAPLGEALNKINNEEDYFDKENNHHTIVSGFEQENTDEHCSRTEMPKPSSSIRTMQEIKVLEFKHNNNVLNNNNRTINNMNNTDNINNHNLGFSNNNNYLGQMVTGTTKHNNNNNYTGLLLLQPFSDQHIDQLVGKYQKVQNNTTAPTTPIDASLAAAAVAIAANHANQSQQSLLNAQYNRRISADSIPIRMLNLSNTSYISRSHYDQQQQQQLQQQQLGEKQKNNTCYQNYAGGVDKQKNIPEQLLFNTTSSLSPAAGGGNGKITATQEILLLDNSKKNRNTQNGNDSSKNYDRSSLNCFTECVSNNSNNNNNTKNDKSTSGVYSSSSCQEGETLKNHNLSGAGAITAGSSSQLVSVRSSRNPTSNQSSTANSAISTTIQGVNTQTNSNNNNNYLNSIPSSSSSSAATGSSSLNVPQQEYQNQKQQQQFAQYGVQPKGVSLIQQQNMHASSKQNDQGVNNNQPFKQQQQLQEFTKYQQQQQAPQNQINIQQQQQQSYSQNPGAQQQELSHQWHDQQQQYQHIQPQPQSQQGIYNNKWMSQSSHPPHPTIEQQQISQPQQQQQLYDPLKLMRQQQQQQDGSKANSNNNTNSNNSINSQQSQNIHGIAPVTHINLNNLNPNNNNNNILNIQNQQVFMDPSQAQRWIALQQQQQQQQLQAQQLPFKLSPNEIYLDQPHQAPTQQTKYPQQQQQLAQPAYQYANIIAASSFPAHSQTSKLSNDPKQPSQQDQQQQNNPYSNQQNSQPNKIPSENNQMYQLPQNATSQQGVQRERTPQQKQKIVLNDNNNQFQQQQQQQQYMQAQRVSYQGSSIQAQYRNNQKVSVTPAIKMQQF